MSEGGYLAVHLACFYTDHKNLELSSQKPMEAGSIEFFNTMINRILFRKESRNILLNSS